LHVQIEINAFFTSPFIVGTGALGDALADKPTLKNGRQQPIIPGSSFKGRLRHTCERLLRALLEEDSAACHAPDPAFTCPLDPAWLGAYCPICRLFGSPRRPSPLFFTDFRWLERGLAAPTLVRTGVSIRRNRRVAEPQRLYNLETVDPLEVNYRGEINGHVTDGDAQALLALLLVGIRDMKTIGGSRSSGLGRCRLEATMRLDGRRLKDEAGWLRQGLEGGIQLWPR
jgi:CRISPR/Cas system CSM-associated protein Csm3 (group 7 of RAMP superfamily)